MSGPPYWCWSKLTWNSDRAFSQARAGFDVKQRGTCWNWQTFGKSYYLGSQHFDGVLTTATLRGWPLIESAAFEPYPSGACSLPRNAACSETEASSAAGTAAVGHVEGSSSCRAKRPQPGLRLTCADDPFRNRCEPSLRDNAVTGPGNGLTTS